VHPALRDWRDEVHSTLLRLIAYLCGLAVLSIAAAHVFRPPPPDVVVIEKPKAEWTEVERPYPAFSLIIPEAADAPTSYAIKRHLTGGGRKDIIALGDPNGTAPYLRVEVYRPGSELEAFPDATTEIASRTREIGADDVTASAEPVVTKFGPMTVVPFVTKDTPRSCLGFVRHFDEPRLAIIGWFCHGGAEAIERSTLACALDRFSLISAGSEPKVTALFARAELQRAFCGQRDPILAPTPKYKALWAALPHHASTVKPHSGLRAYARQFP